MTRLLSEKRIHGKLLLAFKSEIENLKLEQYERQIWPYSWRLFSSCSLDTTVRLNTNQPLPKGLKVSTLWLREARLFEIFIIDST